MRFLLTAAFVLLLVAVTGASPADVQTTNDPLANSFVTQGALGQVLTFEDLIEVKSVDVGDVPGGGVRARLLLPYHTSVLERDVAVGA